MGFAADKFPPGMGLLIRGWDEGIGPAEKGDLNLPAQVKIIDYVLTVLFYLQVGDGSPHGGVDAQPDLVIFNVKKIIHAPSLAMAVRYIGTIAGKNYRKYN